MRTLCFVTLLAVVGHSLLGYAGAEEPQAVIEKAIAAHGGKERLAGLKATRMKASGTVNLGAEVPFTWEITWQSPKQIKIAAELEAAGQKVAFMQGFDGVNAWGSVNGAFVGVEGKKLDELHAQIHLRQVLTLVPLVTVPMRYRCRFQSSARGAPASREKGMARTIAASMSRTGTRSRGISHAASRQNVSTIRHQPPIIRPDVVRLTSRQRTSVESTQTATMSLAASSEPTSHGKSDQRTGCNSG
jgi:hypothetical protein